MRSFANPLAEAERQLAVLDREVAGMELELRNLGASGAVSAEHAVRRAELAYRLRTNIDWLKGQRAGMVAELDRLVLGE